MRGGSSDSVGFDKLPGMDSGKYVRYTPEQLDLLERLYIDCPKPASSRRHQLLRDCPMLANIEPKQIKVWFQNRRCRDKQRKESSRLLVETSVPPAVLVRFLREHRSEWADYNVDAYLASALKASACSLPGLRPTRFFWWQMIMPLAHTVENEEEKPMFTFANKAGLDMLETSLIALQDLTLDKIFDESGQKALFSDISKLMEQGYVYLPSGVCMSGMGRHVSFDQAVAWKVLDEDSNVHCLAFCFVNWSFV